MRNERWAINEANVLAAGDASAIKLKNAKAAPHSVVVSARAHKDDDDDVADRTTVMAQVLTDKQLQKWTNK
jgi:hypothetical protein